MHTQGFQSLPTGKRIARAGFSLVEVTMAMGIMSFCLVAMLGMLPVGLRQARQSSDQATAMQVLAAVRSDFQNVPTSGKSKRFEIPADTADKGSFFVDGALSRTSQQSKAMFQVNYEVAAPQGGQPFVHVFVARIASGPLAQANVLVEGIAQQQFN